MTEPQGQPIPVPPDPEAFSIRPGPNYWNISRIGHAALPTGDTVPMILFVLWDGNNRTATILSGPDAMTMAEMLRSAAGGLHVASEMP